MDRYSATTLVYAVCLVLSVMLIVVYKALLKDKTQRSGFIILTAIAGINLGYFILSISRSLELAIFSNRLSYIGSVVILLEMFTIVNRFCNNEENRAVAIMLHVVSGLALALALTGGSGITWFYKSVEIKTVGNLTRLFKVYGPLNWLYACYVVFMYSVTLAIVIDSISSKRVSSTVNSVIFVFLVTQNILVWFLEKLLEIETELLSVSYVMTGAILIFLFKNIDDYEKLKTQAAPPPEGKTAAEVVDGWKDTYKLTARELDIISSKNRADIAGELFISEHTVKKHISHIYEKLQISSRNELLYRLNEELTSSAKES